MLRLYFASLSVLLFGAILSPGDVTAQVPSEWNAASMRMTRAELTQLLENFETASASPVYGRQVSEAAEREARLVRERLESGDFRVGDRIELSVVGEAGMPSEVIVGPGPAITLPVVGAIPLGGVLRSELTSHLTTHIARFIRDPQVTARSLVGIGLLGSVTSPGFYAVPAEALLADAIMIAGGLAPSADIATARVVRGGVVVIDSEVVTQALSEGRTIDQLNMSAGDQIVIDAQSTGGVSLFRTVLITALTVGVTVLLGR